MSEPKRALYCLFFCERTVMREGYLLLVGVAVFVGGRLFDAPLIARVGLWMSAPFIATLTIALLVLAPYFWLTGRKRV